MQSAVAILGVEDVAAAVAYFNDRLGFSTVAVHGEPDGPPVYGIVSRGEVAFHLQAGWSSRVGERSGHETDAYVYVDDVEALYAEFDDKGVRFYRTMVDNDYGMRDFCIETPDGHRLAFGSPGR